MLLDSEDRARRARRARWSLTDRLIVLAYDMYESSLCDGCAQRVQRSYNPEMDGLYQVQPVRCYGCKALEDARSKQKDAKGMKNFIVDAGRELPDYALRLRPIDPDEWAELNG